MMLRCLRLRPSWAALRGGQRGRWNIHVYVLRSTYHNPHQRMLPQIMAVGW